MKYAVVLICSGFLGTRPFLVLQNHTVIPFHPSSELPEDALMLPSERSAAKYAMAYKGDALVVPTGSFKILHVEYKHGKIPCGGCGTLMDASAEVALCENCRTLSTKEVSWAS